MQKIHLEPAIYHAFVEGGEIQCPAGTAVHTGDHVMVFKKTIAAVSGVSVPHPTQHADSIGVEAIVTNSGTSSADGLSLKKL